MLYLSSRITIELPGDMENRLFNPIEYAEADQKVAIVSGPSGAGKGTLIKNAIQNDNSIVLPVSFTTREMRPGETNGVEYSFVGRDYFNGLIEDQKLAEWAEYAGNLYGSPSLEVALTGLPEVATLLYEVEAIGAQNLLDSHHSALWVGVLPPSVEELDLRLRIRGENDPTIKKRLVQWLSVERPILECGEGRYSPDVSIVNSDLVLATESFCMAIASGRPSGASL